MVIDFLLVSCQGLNDQSNMNSSTGATAGTII